jgi:nucleoside-diphosphate-sugar epimerase
VLFQSTLIAQLAGKSITIKNIPGPVGVLGRNSHNKLIKETIGWAPTDQLEYGIQQLYLWISDMIEKGKQ